MVDGKRKNDEPEFVQAHVIVSVELKCPMQWGKRKVSHLDVTVFNQDDVSVGDGILIINTIAAGIFEFFPLDNVVKWRVVSHLVPPLEGYEFDTYEYSPYTYPERVGGYLGSYSNDAACLGFLDSGMQITLMKDLEAKV